MGASTSATPSSSTRQPWRAARPICGCGPPAKSRLRSRRRRARSADISLGCSHALLGSRTTKAGRTSLYGRLLFWYSNALGSARVVGRAKANQQNTPKHRPAQLILAGRKHEPQEDYEQADQQE